MKLNGLGRTDYAGIVNEAATRLATDLQETVAALTGSMAVMGRRKRNRWCIYTGRQVYPTAEHRRR